MNNLLEPNVLIVILGTSVLGCAAAVVGMFSFLQKRSLTGDAIAHAVLPGVCLAFMLSGEKDPFYLIIGATISGWLSLLAIDVITRKTKIKADAAIGIALSVFFGVGILFLTVIQRSGNAAQSGLDSFLFGKAASMSRNDIKVFCGLAVVLLLVVTAFFKEFKLITFNRDYAVAAGLPVKLFDFILSTLNVLAVAAGIQAVGVVLMAALLITPATAARFWSNNLFRLLILSAAFGILSGMAGSVISLVSPAMPTGPWIVVVLTAIAVFSIIFAPSRGILALGNKKRKNTDKINRENILKIFYHLGENKDDFTRSRNREELQSLRDFQSYRFKNGLKQLRKTGLIEKHGNDWRLTGEGLHEARRIVRLHRLWELYLTRRLNLPSDHVHQDAEAIEHIITPEVEALLQHDLSYPAYDPHNSAIPKS